MKEQMKTLIERITEDYAMFTNRCRYVTDEDYANERIAEFAEKIRVEEGRKYLKIITDKCVWGFVVNVDDDKKFAKGDILMAAGYNAPARNKMRGNILDDNYVIRWTGPLYLK
jgi:2-methylcitrate dehydratase PrpD